MAVMKKTEDEIMFKLGKKKIKKSSFENRCHEFLMGGCSKHI